MKIQVLGSGCATCKKLHKAAEEVVKKLHLNTEVEYSTDVTKIVELGAMSSPVFAIDGEVITAGKAPTSAEIEKAITDKMNGSPLQKNKSNGGCCCGNNNC